MAVIRHQFLKEGRQEDTDALPETQQTLSMANNFIIKIHRLSLQMGIANETLLLQLR